MPNIAPFGSNTGSGTYNVGPQEFCGGLIASFSCSSDFASQGGSLTADVVEDDINGYKFNTPVISAPTGFLIRDLDGNTIFRFNGIFESISRNVSVDGGKVYKVSLSTPLKIIQAVSIITDTYTGYGGALEGLPRYYSADGYYNTPDNPANYLPLGVSKAPSGEPFQVDRLSFGTNNSNLSYRDMWANQYNLMNVFGAFENDQAGIVNFKGFGASAQSDNGMTLDRVCYALDDLINRTASGDAQRYLGGNILFGTNTYNVCAVQSEILNPTPYFYGFDAIGFYQQVRPYLTSDYRIKGPLSILDMVTQVCNEINADFLVNLDLVNYIPGGSGNTTDYTNTTYSVYPSGTFVLAQTYPNSLLGGVISIQVLPRNSYVNCDRPFSDIAYNLFQLEIPNVGGYGYESQIHPGILPTGYIDPLDDDFTSVGTRGSTPYGGMFPRDTGNSTGTSLSDHLNRITEGNVTIRANDGTTSKMVVGGYQTRMITVDRDFIYHYWGDIKIQTSGIPSCTGLNRSSDKVVPVITQLLPPNDILDIILVDISDIIPRNVDFWNPVFYEDYWHKIGYTDFHGYGLVSEMQRIFSERSQVGIQPIHSGIYFASVAEIRAAMTSVDEWVDFLTSVKKEKLACLTNFATCYTQYLNNISTINYNKAIARAPKVITTRPFKTKRIDAESVFTGYRSKLDAKIQVQGSPEELETDDLLDKIGLKLKAIGDQHYGKSWYVPVPFFTSKVTQNNDNLFGNYVRSWDITQSAYVEPSLYYSIDAPFDSRFTDDGRLKPYVNYPYLVSTGNLGYDLFTDSIYGFSVETSPTFDFSEYPTDSLVVDNTGCYPNPLVHAPPTNIEEKYQFIPCNYFAKYSRYIAPFFEITVNGTLEGADGVGRIDGLFGNTYVYQTALRTGVMPSTALNSCGVNSHIVTSRFNETGKLIALDTTGVMANGHSGFFIQFPTVAQVNITNNLLGLPFSDNGLNSLPFVKVTTERVFYPKYEDSGLSVNDKNFKVMLALLSVGMDAETASQYIEKFPTTKSKSNLTSDFELFPPVVPPYSIAIPQKSNRFVYGPWMTDYTILYCGKAEFEVDETLVPENFIIPNYGSLTLAGGTFSSGISSQTSGFAGLNLAGQSIANSIDNFSLFANEEGTITMPGLPIISYLGQTLASFPRITDLQVNISPNNITTTYNFRQNSPRLFRTNRDVVKLLTQISKTIKK